MFHVEQTMLKYGFKKGNKGNSRLPERGNKF